jgi:hypothetical protein
MLTEERPPEERSSPVTVHRWLGMLLIVAALAGGAAAQVANDKVRDAALREVSDAQDRLRRTEKLAAQRAADEKDLVIARYQVIDAKYQLAQIDREPQRVQIGYAQQLVDIYQEYFELMSRLQRKDKVAVVEVDGARLGLAEAKIRLEMHVLIDIHERQVERYRKLVAAKAATPDQLETAYKALDDARRRLAELPR